MVASTLWVIGGVIGIFALAVARAGAGGRSLLGDLVGMASVAAVLYGLTTALLGPSSLEEVGGLFGAPLEGLRQSVRAIGAGQRLTVDPSAASLWLFVSGGGLLAGLLMAAAGLILGRSQAADQGSTARARASVRLPLAGLVAANLVFVLMGPTALGGVLGW